MRMHNVGALLVGALSADLDLPEAGHPQGVPLRRNLTLHLAIRHTIC